MNKALSNQNPSVSDIKGGTLDDAVKSRCGSLQELPLEILGSILNSYLPHPSRLQMRQVASLFQVLYDDYIGFKVSLEPSISSEKLSFISEIAIRKALIVEEPEEDTSSPSKSSLESIPLLQIPFSSLFLYPQYLQEFIVKGKIPASLLSSIVLFCGNLETLELSPGSEIIPCASEPPKDINPPPSFFLKNIRTLKLLLNNKSTLDTNCESVLSIMKSTRSSTLSRAVLQGWISPSHSISEITLASAEFLLQNPSIQSFFIGIIFEHLLEDGEPLTPEDLEIRPKILSTLRLASRQMNVQKFGISTRSQDMILWKDFLSTQPRLVHVSFTVDLIEGIFSQQFFLPFRKTLKQFILRGNFISTFDFDWLSDCSQLKEICLHNLQGEQEPNSVHVVNGGAVPSSLESLVLFQTVARTDEVIAAIRKLKELHTLVLFRTGNVAGETGTNLECLKLILRSRTLSSILLVRFVAPNPLEASELARMLKFFDDGRVSLGQPNLPELMDVFEVDLDLEQLEPELEVIGQNDVDTDSGVNFSGASNLQNETAVNSFGASGGGGSNFQNDIKAQESQIDNDNTSGSGGGSTCSQNETGTQNPSCSGGSSGASSSSSKKHSEDEKSSCKPSSVIGTHSMPIIDEASCKSEQKTKTLNLEGEESRTPTPLVSSMEPHVLPPGASTPQQEKNDLNDGGESGRQVPDDSSTSATHGSRSSTTQVSECDDNWVDINDNDEEYAEGSEHEAEVEDEEGVFDLDLGFDFDDLNLNVIEQVEGEGGGQNFQLVLNLQNEADLQEMLGLLEPIAAENLNNLTFGFILDGVIDIMSPTNDNKRSRWVAVEDEQGHLTYTLKISID